MHEIIQIAQFRKGIVILAPQTNTHMSTDQAFEALVKNRYAWIKSGLPPRNRVRFLFMFRHKKNIRIDTKTKYLKRAGFTEITQPTWQSPF
jgi:hypothetical protein